MIKLTSKSIPVWVNPAQVCSVEGNLGSGCTLHLTGGWTVEADQSADHVMTALRVEVI